MEDGWIKLHRKMREWQHYSEPSVVLVFLDILFSANTKTTIIKGDELKPGQTNISIDSICENTGLSRNTVRAAIKRLVDTGEIERTQKNTWVLTTINNFDKYQGPRRGSKIDHTESKRGSKNDPQGGQNLTMRGSKIDPEQEYKEYKEIDGGGERARVREEAMSEIKVENACRAFSISKQEYVELVDQVLCDWTACDETDWSYRHLYNTLRIKASEKRRNNGTTKIINGAAGTSAEGREQRAAAVAATIARLAAEDDARAAKVS